MSRCKSASVIVNGHREGELLARTLRSAVAAKHVAARDKIRINILLVLDNADSATRAVAKRFGDELAAVHEVSYRNLGDSRQHGVREAKDDWLFFLDGDDLISDNWFAAAAAHANADRQRKATVYHTELFVGFDAQVFYRRAMSTDDPEFDPYGLICDWFFCNNLFVHRSILTDCPIQPYDHDAGYGAEDWHWSCETTARGIRRDFVPGTAYFYRIKPAELSLGMTSGLIHKTTELFSTDYLDRYRSTFSKSATSRAEVAAEPKLARFRQSVPAWYFELAERGAMIDAKITETIRFALSNPAAAKTFPPRLHYGAGLFYRSVIGGFTRGEKIGIWWGANPASGGGALLPDIVAMTRKHFGKSQQIVVMSELDSFENRRLQALYTSDDVLIVDAKDTLDHMNMPDHYLAAVLIRLFIQFRFKATINVASTLLPVAAQTYPKALRTEAPSTLHIFLQRGLDHSDMELSHMLGSLRAFRMQSNSGLVATDRLARHVSAQAGVPIRVQADPLFAQMVEERLTPGGTPGKAAYLPGPDTLAALLDVRAPASRATTSQQRYKHTAFVLHDGGETQLAGLERAMGSALGQGKRPTHRNIVITAQRHLGSLPFATEPSTRFKGGQRFRVAEHPNIEVHAFASLSIGDALKLIEKRTASKDVLIASAKAVPSAGFLQKAFGMGAKPNKSASARTKKASRGGVGMPAFVHSVRGPVFDICDRQSMLHGGDATSILLDTTLSMGALTASPEFIARLAERQALSSLPFTSDLCLLVLAAMAVHDEALSVLPETVVGTLSPAVLTMDQRLHALEALALDEPMLSVAE